MINDLNISNAISWFFGVLVVTIGVLNLFLVHPVPGIAYLLLSLIYLPPSYTYLTEKFDFSFPALAKIGLGVFIIWFTLGVSDLGDMIDKL